MQEPDTTIESLGPVSSPSGSPKTRLAASVAALPVLIIDRREQAPLPFSQLATRPGTLNAEDYSIAGAETLFGIERKTIADLITSCTSDRERFERELVRLRGFKFRRLVIVGSEADIIHGNFRSLANPKAVIATLHCFEIRYDLPVVFCVTPELAGRLIERWAVWFAREIKKAAHLLEEVSG
jgi:ERCC4-type nuclease